jgi:hypothetical protein
MRLTEWREDAMAWINNQAAKLPAEPKDPCEIGRPTTKACETAIQVIKVLGPEAPPPSALLATPSEGIEIEWRHGSRLLSVEIMPDGTLESLKSVGGEPIEEDRLFEPDWRVHSLVEWVQSAA